jgi:hypothetical protein
MTLCLWARRASPIHQTVVAHGTGACTACGKTCSAHGHHARVWPVRLTWRGACRRTGGANPTPVRENDPWHSANAPLHWDLKGDGSNGVLTRFELSSVLALDVEEGNGVEGGCPVAAHARGRCEEATWTLGQ